MDKRIFYLVAGALGILLVALAIMVSILGTKQNNQPAGLNTNQVNNQPEINNQTANPTSVKDAVVPNNSDSSPEKIALEFYDWYRSQPNPLESRAYKKNNLISSAFMLTLDDFVLIGDYKENDPVLNCIRVDRKPGKLVPGDATIDYANQKATVILYEETGEKKEWYRAVLVNENNKWLIKDFFCAF